MTDKKFEYRVCLRKGDPRNGDHASGSLNVLWVDSFDNSVSHLRIEHNDYRAQCSSSILLTRLHAVQLMKAIALTLKENPDG